MRQNKRINFDNIYETFYKTDKIHQSLIDEIENSLRNFSIQPSNSTIKLEYVKCGKSNCNKCSENYHYRYHGHGPYYYTYWRDKQNNGRLKKKYIRQDDSRVSYVRGLLDTLKNY